MRRLLFLRVLLLLLPLIILFPTMGQAELSTSANQAVLIEQTSGRILYEKNAHDERPIASLTKVMTAIIAIESGQLEDIVVPSERAIYTHGSSIYLQREEKITLEDLIYGLMLRSGNDAAVAIAEHIGGSVEGFAFLMNEKANYIGMTQTRFTNPHGLDEPLHYSTAYDLALLMKYAMENDTFRNISKTKSYRSENRTYHWNNKNKLLTQMYPHSTGGKTGFTKKAGRTLVTTAEKDGLGLIAVTLNASNDWQDHMEMYEWGFDQFELKKLITRGNHKLYLFEQNQVDIIFDDDIYYPLKDEELAKITQQTSIQKEGNSYSGDISFFLEEEKLMEIPINIDDSSFESSKYFTRVIQIIKEMLQVM